MTNHHHENNLADNEDYNPVLSLIRNQLKISGQEIIVRDEKWTQQFTSFLVHGQEDVVAASLQLLEQGVISSRELNLTPCNPDAKTIWSNYYLIGIKKPHNSLETEFLKLDFLNQKS
ncbi:hypothetical protein H1P_480039 [Hyella patelloides LEGE 07179]|uniref:Uncharacterized protein n=1 Tax=Hyella patelloides LEGE 07179 TaxID=945734 RepID=A0A563VYZ5_9CYAN|nr:hypothetical protein [Hyella patelloides]VEP16678.1 hypothetical protein H1P_480039 [Hyella patelloides LEGE 07179]